MGRNRFKPRKRALEFIDRNFAAKDQRKRVRIETGKYRKRYEILLRDEAGIDDRDVVRMESSQH